MGWMFSGGRENCVMYPLSFWNIACVLTRYGSNAQNDIVVSVWQNVGMRSGGGSYVQKLPSRHLKLGYNVWAENKFMDRNVAAPHSTIPANTTAKGVVPYLACGLPTYLQLGSVGSVVECIVMGQKVTRDSYRIAIVLPRMSHVCMPNKVYIESGYEYLIGVEVFEMKESVMVTYGGDTEKFGR